MALTRRRKRGANWFAKRVGQLRRQGHSFKSAVKAAKSGRAKAPSRKRARARKRPNLFFESKSATVARRIAPRHRSAAILGWRRRGKRTAGIHESLIRRKNPGSPKRRKKSCARRRNAHSPKRRYSRRRNPGLAATLKELASAENLIAAGATIGGLTAALSIPALVANLAKKPDLSTGIKGLLVSAASAAAATALVAMLAPKYAKSVAVGATAGVLLKGLAQLRGQAQVSEATLALPTMKGLAEILAPGQVSGFGEVIDPLIQAESAIQAGQNGVGDFLDLNGTANSENYAIQGLGQGVGDYMTLQM